MFSLSSVKSVTSTATPSVPPTPASASTTPPPSPKKLISWPVRVLACGKIDPTPPADVYKKLKAKNMHTNLIYRIEHLAEQEVGKERKFYFGSVTKGSRTNRKPNDIMDRFSNYKFELNSRAPGRKRYVRNAMVRSPTKFIVSVIERVKGSARKVHQREGEYIVKYGTLDRKRGYNQAMPPEGDEEKAYCARSKKKIRATHIRQLPTRKASAVAKKNIQTQASSPNEKGGKGPCTPIRPQSSPTALAAAHQAPSPQENGEKDNSPHKRIRPTIDIHEQPSADKSKVVKKGVRRQLFANNS